MPNILVKIPRGAFPGGARAQLAHNIEKAAARAEQMPEDPRHRALCWVLVEEIDAGLWTCGGRDVGAQVLTCFALALVPAGVLDAPSRALCVRSMHDAFVHAMPADDTRRLHSSVIVQEVAEGHWGGDGALWTLPALAQAAGYVHLQHLVAEVAA
ncbi:tautomerase [Variovorax boronicumulans]|uniref:tautomerase n=1 Tax=Variovorax boronicumulans TaxID=436515 RepID=UPI001C5826A0